ncbi:MAG TPA: tetratricopeptide repeat protein [Thermoanaerobaculia bacterium]|nr:tetratricopeptide repeat protein [Thermoanaerobaculia bacterium]
MASYLDGAADRDASTAVEAHLACCDRCRRRVEIVRRAMNAGIGAVGSAYEEVVTLTGRLLAEPVYRWTMLAKNAEYHHPGVVRRLLTLAVEERELQIVHAAEMAHAAAVIAAAIIGEAGAVCELRFDAWKLHSALLREAGRYDDCRAALDRAERAAVGVKDVELARGAILLSRALICAEPDIWLPEEAVALLAVAEEIYTRRDLDWLRRVLTVRGMVLLRNGKADEARERFERVLAQTDPANERAYAKAQTNLGWSLLAVGDLESARIQLDRAIEADMRHGVAVDVGRDLCLRSRIFQETGEHEAAIQSAEESMRTFQKCGRPDEAVRAGLVAVQSYTALSDGEAARHLAIMLAERSIELDRLEPSRRRSLTAEAVSYARELAERRSLTEDVAAAVRVYVEELAIKPAVAFNPPLPLAIM